MHTFAFRSKFEVILTEWLVLEFLLGFFATAANDCIPPYVAIQLVTDLSALPPLVVRLQDSEQNGLFAPPNTALSGLYLVVDPSGARRWVLRVTVKRKRRDLGLGDTS